MRSNIVTVLTPRAQVAEEVNPDVVVQALEATKTPAHSPKEQEEKLKAQERARDQLRVARHARG